MLGDYVNCVTLCRGTFLLSCCHIVVILLTFNHTLVFFVTILAILGKYDICNTEYAFDAEYLGSNIIKFQCCFKIVWSRTFQNHP